MAVPASGAAGAAGDRDRDERGRPRSARARDATGRPLPRGARGPEHGGEQDPEHGGEQDPEEGAEQVPETPEQALELAQQLIDSGWPFAAHEVLEAMWKSCPAEQRDLWRGLAQLAVGLTHIQRGNHAAAATLLRRGADRLGAFRRGQQAHAPWPFGVAGAALLAEAAMLADDVTAGRPVPPEGTRLDLRAPR